MRGRVCARNGSAPAIAVAALAVLVAAASAQEKSDPVAQPTAADATAAAQADDDATAAQAAANYWRAERRLVDTHVHIEPTEERYARAIKILDRAGVGVAVNLDGGTVTRDGEKPSAFETHRDLVNRLHPGRFLLGMHFDWSRYDAPDFDEQAARQIEEGVKQGAACLKEWKRLGLWLKDGAGKLIPIDTPKLDRAWEKCAELGLPVLIHVADPKAFWLPYDEKNERWEELKDHPNWWFGDPAKYPPRDELFAALLRVVERHPRTTFVSLHFADDPEELSRVEAWLDLHPNLWVDVAARIPEIGRSDPRRVRDLFLKHQDRILFATDFMVYDRLILGSGGNGPPPSDADAADFYAKHWRFFETNDRGFAHMTPIQGNWTIDAIGLPESALRKIYFDNARRLLARAWPPAELHAARVASEPTLNGFLRDPAWSRARVFPLEQGNDDGAAHPAICTPVRALWTQDALLLGFECPYREITAFTPPDSTKERMGLWERDVVELFVGRDAGAPGRYFEFDLAPTGEKLDVAVDLPKKDFAWSAPWKAAVFVDAMKRRWLAELRIPFAAIGGPPKAGERWRANVYRCDRATRAELALRPTLTSTFHQPDRFGWLVFDE